MTTRKERKEKGTVEKGGSEGYTLHSTEVAIFCPEEQNRTK